MAVTTSGKIRLEVELRERLSQGLKVGVMPSKVVQDLDLANGTTDGKIDLGYYTQVTGGAASTTTVYDLAGSLTDIGGNTITFAEVVAIYLYNRRATALAYLTVGPDATNGFGALASGKGFWADASDRSVVGPASWLMLYDKVGVPVSGGSTDELAVTTSAVSGSTNAWDIVILGRSA